MFIRIAFYYDFDRLGPSISALHLQCLLHPIVVSQSHADEGRRMLVERASGFHEHILSKKVEQLGADPWHRRFFFSDDRGHKNRLETVEASKPISGCRLTALKLLAALWAWRSSSFLARGAMGRKAWQRWSTCFSTACSRMSTVFASRLLFLTSSTRLRSMDLQSLAICRRGTPSLFQCKLYTTSRQHLNNSARDESV